MGRNKLQLQLETSQSIHECDLDEVVLDIEKAINMIASNYRRVPGLILSEDDLKCALYHKLYPIYSHPFHTLDRDVLATALHTETPWYDRQNLLTLRPDLSIIDPRQLSILHGIGEHTRRSGNIGYRLPSKGFEFGGEAVAIEIKFVRSMSGISRRHILSFQEDIDKMQDLCERHNRNSRKPGVKGVLVIFSKTRRGVELINVLASRNASLRDIKILYRTAEIDKNEDLKQRLNYKAQTVHRKIRGT